MFYGSIGGGWIDLEYEEEIYGSLLRFDCGLVDIKFVVEEGEEEEEEAKCWWIQIQSESLSWSESKEQILLMFEQIIAFTLHLSISVCGLGDLSLWCRKYEWLLDTLPTLRVFEGNQGRQSCANQPRSIFPSISLSMEARPTHTQESLEFNQTETKRKMMKRKMFFLPLNVQWSERRKINYRTMSSAPTSKLRNLLYRTKEKKDILCFHSRVGWQNHNIHVPPSLIRLSSWSGVRWCRCRCAHISCFMSMRIFSATTRKTTEMEKLFGSSSPKAKAFKALEMMNFILFFSSSGWSQIIASPWRWIRYP